MSPRPFFLVFLSLVSIQTVAQENINTDTVERRSINPDNRITNVPSEGILLDKGWRHIIGDNPEFAKPAFDDGSWQPINPTLDVHDTLQQLSAGVVWFRLHLTPDSSTARSQLALVIQQSGASEIYLNGIKIESYGVVSSDLEKVKAHDPLWKPLPVTLNLAGNVLAIRYALQPNISYTKVFETENPAFAIKLMHADDAVDYHHGNASKIIGFTAVLIGISLMIVILHLSFYILYPSQKANLYFAMFAIFYCIGSVTQLLYWLYPMGVGNKFYLGNFTFLFFTLGYVCQLITTYLFLERRKDFSFYFLIALGVIALAFNVWPYGWGWKFGSPIFDLLVQINIARIAILATIKKQRGAWIIAVGAVNTLIFFAIFLSQGTFTNTSFVLSLPAIRIFTYVMQNISLPTASSVFLAFEFAFINRAIQQKLVEVSELSKKNLAHQKEKQQILEAQNETLEKQVQERTNSLTQSLQDLKATQSQLIQSEKMASLGELTAGIAHEIQNPLNFVNNFSDINKELVGELRQEIKKGNLNEADSIADSIETNEEKINHHGRRADAIVKGMLQHSRSSTNVKEPTNINTLADEYLRLAYHGWRAKDKSFQATLNTHYDATIGNIDIVPQDIGRVMLNLINNAFYAVSEKKKQLSENGASDSDGFVPSVSIATTKSSNKIQISIKDNGNGVPEKVMDKIFQPFFTTKPTGQGTGLGLSLSYDIVKAHGGELTAESLVGEGSLFTIQLPLQAHD